MLILFHLWYIGRLLPTISKFVLLSVKSITSNWSLHINNEKTCSLKTCACVCQPHTTIHRTIFPHPLLCFPSHSPRCVQFIHEALTQLNLPILISRAKIFCDSNNDIIGSRVTVKRGMATHVWTACWKRYDWNHTWSLKIPCVIFVQAKPKPSVMISFGNHTPCAVIISHL